ncbi:hypothetical protein NM688_g2432 [Phlebia brevispora]|uniref:Uncharacterized protein n=1 Tax=Phlebia brevispora TaxID=194682 RepID=A0ACC1T8R4_9APHY|nr:hypothetical protein NM688_g2432 [Phlebia brevispora]
MTVDEPSNTTTALPTPKVKTKAKKRYLKAKKERRKKRKAVGTSSTPHKDPSPERSDVDPDANDDEGNESNQEIVQSTEVERGEVEEKSPAKSEKKPPKKRRKVEQLQDEADAVEDVEDNDQYMRDEVQHGEETLQLRRSPTPQVALPIFPLPRQPEGPSKSTLALQGLDKALVEAELVDPRTTVSITLEQEFERTYGLSDKMARRLKDLGIDGLFAVQTVVIPFLLSSPGQKSLYLPYAPPRDVCVSAPTGSGKTLAYVVPIVEILSARVVTRLRALIVLPTRDLVTQVRETFEAVGKGRGLKIGTATGQHSFAHEQTQLVADRSRYLQGGSSKVDILICTPGRLIDHLNGTPNFSLQHLRFLVIDEADRLLAQSFQDWLAQVLAATRLTASDPNAPLADEKGEVGNTLPHPDSLAPAFLDQSRNVPHVYTDLDDEKESSCQKLLFSATLTRDPSKIAALNLKEPKYFVVQFQSENVGSKEEGVLDLVMEKFSMPATLTEHMIICESAQKPLMLFYLVHEHGVKNALVFTKSAESTTRLVRLFEFFESIRNAASGKSGLPEVSLRAYSSELPAGERKAILEQFKNQEIHILVCSDLISRGIDISHVSHVVSYDAPIDMRKYVHRVGRTARAGRAGDAWTLVEEQEARYFKNMMKSIDHLSALKRMRVDEKDVAPLLPHYEGALERLKEVLEAALDAYRVFTRVPKRLVPWNDQRWALTGRKADDLDCVDEGRIAMPASTTFGSLVHSSAFVLASSRTMGKADSEYDAEVAGQSDEVKSGVVQITPEIVDTGKNAPSFFRMPFVPKNPPPSKASIDDADLLPEATAGWLSLLTFNWITNLLALGYARPLEATDLYKLQSSRSAALIAEKIVWSYEVRRRKANEYNARLAKGEIRPGWRKACWFLQGNPTEREAAWRARHGKRRASLTLAMNDSVKWWFWSGGVLKVSSDVATILTPLLVKAIITFATDSYNAHRQGRNDLAPPVGRGVGLAFALMALQLFASLCQHHFFYRSSSTGVLLRGGLITAIYDRSLRLTTRARTVLTNGKLVNHISTDVSRIDFCCGFFHMSWSAPIQMVICLVLLLVNLGPSALAGYAFFVLCTPIQTRVMRRLMGLRQKSMFWTDKRAKLLQELLGGMKIIKYFAWEIPYLKRIGEFRSKEIGYIRSLLMIRAANNAVAITLPVLASVLSFVVYSLSGHSLNAADIFSSLTLFTLLRMPLMFLPLSFSAIADAQNAIERLHGVFEAELITETKVQDPTLDVAVKVVNGSFTWDSPPPEINKGETKETGTEKSHEPADVVFNLQNVNLEIPKGQLTAIVGPVGSGKTSLLEALIGEMRRTSGSVTFNGSVAYCPQSAWIQNATIRDNIIFGRPFEEERYWKAVKDACLETDLDMMPNGDLTEVGYLSVRRPETEDQHMPCYLRWRRHPDLRRPTLRTGRPRRQIRLPERLHERRDGQDARPRHARRVPPPASRLHLHRR